VGDAVRVPDWVHILGLQERANCVSKMKLALLFRNYGPYHYARLQALRTKCDAFGIETEATTVEYPWKLNFECKFGLIYALSSTYPDSIKQLYLVRSRLKRLLAEHKPDVIALPGWSDPVALSCLLICNTIGIPVVVMSDSRLEDKTRSVIEERVKKRFFRFYGAALVAGSPHKRYLADHLGFHHDRIFQGYDVVNNLHFSSGADQARFRDGPVRAAFGLPGRYILACGRLIDRKRLDVVIYAFAQLRATQQFSGLSLVIVGDGPERRRLEMLAGRVAPAGSVRLLGFIDYAELPAIYGLSEAFVLASDSDQWGLVVNEAMASGLPVLVSAGAGCAEDLVVDGINGYTFPPGDPLGLARLLAKVLASGKIRELGNSSRARITNWSTETFGSELMAAAKCSLQNPVAKMKPFDSGLVEATLIYRYTRQ
jgi:1,2-diacylglycerol 3-alpha-glucosyltransferase